MSEETREKKCFVIMPISDVEPYEPGHFSRVYEYIIKPACLAAGFMPLRADDSQMTNYIVIDILRQIIDADMVLCDLSSRNPNVLYELGIRQAFNLPVTLIKDSLTPRIFDIQGLRDFEYDESLRIDTVNIAVEQLTLILKNTYELEQGQINSVVQLMGINPAQIQSPINLSSETSLLLNAINDLGERMSEVESQMKNDWTFLTKKRPVTSITKSYIEGDGTNFKIGDKVVHSKWGQGVIVAVKDNELHVAFPDKGIKRLVEQYANLKKVDESA